MWRRRGLAAASGAWTQRRAVGTAPAGCFIAGLGVVFRVCVALLQLGWGRVPRVSRVRRSQRPAFPAASSRCERPRVMLLLGSLNGALREPVSGMACRRIRLGGGPPWKSLVRGIVAGTWSRACVCDLGSPSPWGSLWIGRAGLEGPALTRRWPGLGPCTGGRERVSAPDLSGPSRLGRFPIGRSRSP